MAIVVDASVALKWVIDEDGSDAARALAINEILIAPDFLFVECANVLWVKARRQQVSKAEAAAALAAIEAMPIKSVAARQHAVSAQSIAFDLDRTVYDCLYLAAALAERAALVTADEAFVRAAVSHPAYSGAVRLLSP